MSTHNICFYGEIRKIIQELSLNTPPYQVTGILPAQNYYGPLKGARGPCPIQIHVKFRILMGLFKF